jgi:predicted Rossmann fold flavoprotein
MTPHLRARKIILATGGRSVPKTGSDGHGYELARSLGHSTTPRILPGLVPLRLREGHFLREVSGLSFPGRLVLASATGKHLCSLTGSVLCTHFGLSGPLVLDMSRHYLQAVAEDPGTHLLLDFLPGQGSGDVDAALTALGSRSPARYLHEALPERLARALCSEAGIDSSLPGNQLSREARRRLVRTVTALDLPVTGNRGFTHAEVTAGGIPLAQLHLDTLASRVTPGLHLCGELCDVDGRIGGFNFQWAWASGWVAGRGAADLL